MVSLSLCAEGTACWKAKVWATLLFWGFLPCALTPGMSEQWALMVLHTTESCCWIFLFLPGKLAENLFIECPEQPLCCWWLPVNSELASDKGVLRTEIREGKSLVDESCPRNRGHAGVLVQIINSYGLVWKWQCRVLFFPLIANSKALICFVSLWSPCRLLLHCSATYMLGNSITSIAFWSLFP